MGPAVFVLVFVVVFVLAIYSTKQDRARVEARVLGAVVYREDEASLRTTWRSPISWKLSITNADVRVTRTEAFVLRVSPSGMPQPTLRLVLRPERDAHDAPGHPIPVTAMSTEGDWVVIDGTTRGWGTVTLRLQSREPERLLAALESVRQGAPGAPYRSQG